MSSKNKFYFIKGNNVYLRPFKLKDISKKYLDWLNNPEINYGIEARFPVSEIEAKNFFKETQGLKSKILFAICDKYSFVIVSTDFLKAVFSNNSRASCSVILWFIICFV